MSKNHFKEMQSALNEALRSSPLEMRERALAARRARARLFENMNKNGLIPTNGKCIIDDNIEELLSFDTAHRNSYIRYIRDKILRLKFTVWKYNKKLVFIDISEIRPKIIPKSKLSLFISKVKKWIN